MRPTLRESDATNLAGQDTGRQHLSHTKVSIFLACERKFDLHYLQRLELIARPRAFTLGTAYQKAIEHQDPEVGVRFLNGFEPCKTCGARGYVPIDDADADPDALLVFPAGERALQLDDMPEPLGAQCPTCEGRTYTGEQLHFWTREDEDRHLVNQAIVRGASTLYLKLFPTPAGEKREFEFKVRLRNPWTGRYSNTYDLLGYADGLIDPWHGAADLGVEPEHPTFEIVENKLTDRLMPASVKRLPLDRQIALERYGVWRATGRPVERVHYRFVLKPSIKQRGGRKKDKSDAESIGEFCERVEADYEKRPEFYARPQDPVLINTDRDLLRVEADLWKWAHKLRGALAFNYFDRDTSHCSDFGGCQFLPICTGDPDAPTLYRVRPRRDQAHQAALDAIAATANEEQ